MGGGRREEKKDEWVISTWTLSSIYDELKVLSSTKSFAIDLFPFIIFHEKIFESFFSSLSFSFLPLLPLLLSCSTGIFINLAKFCCTTTHFHRKIRLNQKSKTKTKPKDYGNCTWIFIILIIIIIFYKLNNFPKPIHNIVVVVVEVLVVLGFVSSSSSSSSSSPPPSIPFSINL